MDKGSHTAHFERLVPLDPVSAHKAFLEKTWWGGGLPWYLNLMTTYQIEAPKDDAGTGGTRQVPLGLHEKILNAEMGKFIEYTVARKLWFPVTYHRGRVNFYEAGPGYTRMVWEINFTPMPHGHLIFPFFWIVIGIMADDFQNECNKRSKTAKKRFHNSGSWVWFLVKVFLALYVVFMVSRASRIPKMKPQPPGAEYVRLTEQFRAESAHLSKSVAKHSFLLIGGSGFTGSAIVDDLRKRGAKHIKVMGRSFPPVLEYPYSFKTEDRYPIKGVEYVRGDVTDMKALTNAMKDVDVVYHIAVSYGNPMFGALRGLEATERINVQGMKNIYEAAKAAKTVRQIIYTSSADTVFTTRPLNKVNETHPYLEYGVTDLAYAQKEFAVGDAYARTKILAEQFLLSMDNKDNIRTISIRPNGIYGPGEMSNWKKTLDVPFILGGVPFYFDENQKTDWSCLYNLVYAHVLATYKLETDPSPVGGKAYFITDDELTNNAAWGIFKPAIEATGGPVKLWLKIPAWILPHAGHAQEVFDKFMTDKFGISVPPFLTFKEAHKATTTHYYDISRARKDLGYKPLISTPLCQALTAEEMQRRYWGNY